MVMPRLHYPLVYALLVRFLQLPMRLRFRQLGQAPHNGAAPELHFVSLVLLMPVLLLLLLRVLLFLRRLL